MIIIVGNNGLLWRKNDRTQFFITLKNVCYLKKWCFLQIVIFSDIYHFFVTLKNGVFFKMVILIVFKWLKIIKVRPFLRQNGPLFPTHPMAAGEEQDRYNDSEEFIFS